LTALAGLLIRKGVITAEEFNEAVGQEAEQLSADYSNRFRGMRATDAGISYDFAVIQEHGTMDGWLP
jgi:hypothetical protein